MIYEPEEDSYLLQEQVKLFAKGRVLDIGTGSGIQAIAASKKREVNEVVACDINEEAVLELKKQKLPKIKVVKSNLFKNIKGNFDTIIFNPPYLPNDETDPDIALDGGEIGNEIIQKFLEEASRRLNSGGFILLLFSNKTPNMLKIIKETNYSAELLSNKKLAFFEELYVYKLLPTKSNFFAQGKRGLIYKVGNLCVKEKNPLSEIDTIENEANMLRILNKKKIGPKLKSYKNNKLTREFIEGVSLEEFLKHSEKKSTLKVFESILSQCRIMDELKINKTELTNPYKDILVDTREKPVLIDFERCKITEKPKNVTQFLQYIARNSSLLEKKNIIISKEEIITLGKTYKKKNERNFFQKNIKPF